MGKIIRITGPVVIADEMKGSEMYELVRVGDEGLIGEIIGLTGERATIQVYEETSGIKPGEKVEGTGKPLSVELGPGLIGAIYDGTQRPLTIIRQKTGDMITRGIFAHALPRDKKWKFVPKVKKGADVIEGDVLGTVKESKIVEHRILVPPGISGKVTEIAEGDHKVEDIIAVIETKDGKKEIPMMQVWPVRKARPYKEKLDPREPLISGQRVIDTFFPIAKGGTAAIPGGFGTGKCVTSKTPVLLGDGSLKPIEDIYQEVRRKGELIMANDRERVYSTAGLGNPTVVALDGDELRIVEPTAVYRGLADSIIKLETSSGTEVEVTPCHKLIVYDPESCEIKETPARNLNTGDYLVVPKRLPINGQKNVRIDVLKLLGHADDLFTKDCSGIVAEAFEKNGNALKIKLGKSGETIRRYKRGGNVPLSLIKTCAGSTKRMPRVTWISPAHGKKVKIPPAITPALAEFLGYLVGDGSMKENTYTIRFFNADINLVKKFAQLVTQLFGISKITIKKSRGNVFLAEVSSKALFDFLVSIGNPSRNKSRNIKLPSCLLTANAHELMVFLNAYIECDGSYDSVTGRIEISTASPEFAVQLRYALQRFSILSKMEKRMKAKKGRKYTWWRITIPAEYTKLLTDDGKKRISKKIASIGRSQTRESRMETFPFPRPAANEILKNHLIEKLNKKGLYTACYIYDKERETLPATYVKIVSSLQHSINADTFKKLEKLARILKWVYFEKVIKKEEELGPKPVFDFIVPQGQCFVGGFGPAILHNTVMLHQFAKWSAADIIVYVGAGERGNEMCDVLVHFPLLKDPRTGKSLMERTTLIANTSNMPVAAREAGVYTGITIAEYFRDMGYDVALMADSTSRWAEAMREISGRLEEMPGEEGFPAYLASRLAEFYERAGRVRTLGGDERYGSVTVLGAVSPPGGDLSEPVSQNTLRIVKVFWALDTALADRRHFPAIHWLTSYSLYVDSIKDWWKRELAEDWKSLRDEAIAMLQKEAELEEIVKLVGPDALPERERAVLEAARMMREDFLQQFAFHEVDTYCPVKKQLGMFKLVLGFYRNCVEATKRGVSIGEIRKLPIKDEIAGMKRLPPEEFERKYKVMEKRLKEQFEEILRTKKAPGGTEGET